MRKMKEVVADHPEYATVIRAVIKRIGMDSVEDVNNHGIDGGYSGFIYCTDTVAFWKKYKKSILSMLSDDADSFGMDKIEMIRNFNCLSSGSWNNRKPDFSIDEICGTIYGRDNDTTIQNAMAWYAAEMVCRWFED